MMIKQSDGYEKIEGEGQEYKIEKKPSKMQIIKINKSPPKGG